MNREVYKHVLKTYGRNPGQWIGFFAEVIHVLILRVYIVIAAAQITTYVASGNIDAAKQSTLYLFGAYLVGAIIGTLGELLSIYTENQEYGRIALVYYRKLVGKDVAFYRDNQTGYLTTAFRQYLD